MLFEMTDRAKMIEEQLRRFMDEHVYPNERTYQLQIEESGDPHFEPPIMQELRAKARGIGLWNLFLPDAEWGAGLTNLEYTPLCEIMGRSPIAPRVFNCQAPDTGNAAILRGGSESFHSSAAINDALQAGLRAAGLPEASSSFAARCGPCSSCFRKAKLCVHPCDSMRRAQSASSASS